MKLPENVEKPLRVALVSLLVCGLLFPLAVTGISELVFPYQANGEQVTLNNTTVGSALIAQDFNASVFFHPRNSSASSVDPDITIGDAYGQIGRISNATGISGGTLKGIVNSLADSTLFFFGSRYVNIISLNLYLIKHYPSIYDRYV